MCGHRNELAPSLRQIVERICLVVPVVAALKGIKCGIPECYRLVTSGHTQEHLGWSI